MSTERGNVKKGAPKYQNDFAFKHNPKSKKTLKILSLPNEGLCNRCHEVVEWKKKYRKYKPLTTPKRCSNCQEKNVKHAYHILCINCARNLKVCAKCKEGKQIVTPMKTEEEKREQEKQLKEKLEAMSERERRAYNRSLSRDPNADPAEALARAQKQSKDSDSDDFDDLDDLDSGGENEQEEKEEDDENEEDHIDAESDNEDT